MFAGGKVFLIDGAGSRGSATANTASYGSTKAAMPQLLRSLAAETKKTKVSVHLASPGMVATDLLLKGVSSPTAAKFVNILAEDPHVVAAWLVPRMRGVTGNGKYFKWVTHLIPMLLCPVRIIHQITAWYRDVCKACIMPQMYLLDASQRWAVNVADAQQRLLHP